MNCPSRPDSVEDHPDWNQSPHALNGDATTRADLNGIINLRALREHEINPTTAEEPIQQESDHQGQGLDSKAQDGRAKPYACIHEASNACVETRTTRLAPPLRSSNLFIRARDVLYKYAQFVGPGFLIAVAYIDPGNYATDVQAGASTRYGHLFVVLMSNLFAIFLQSLCIKLGSVTGLDLAANCRKHLPKWLTIALYIAAEAAIVATDIAEVCTCRMHRVTVVLLTFTRSLVQR